MARISAADVEEIRLKMNRWPARSRVRGSVARAFALRFGVSAAHVCNVAAGREGKR